jgi:hypothetical protein
MKHSIHLRLILLLTGIVLVSHVLAQTPPKLVSVYPKQGTGEMEIKWDWVSGAEEFEYRVKENNGAWSVWISTGQGTATTEVMLDESVTYTYQVRVKVGGMWSMPSNEKKNGFTTIWPVYKAGDSTAQSVELLHGFGQPIEAGNQYFHEGIDIHGESGVDGEYVRAPVGGIVLEHGGSGSNIAVLLQVYVNGGMKFIEFNHLQNLRHFDIGESVAVGEVIGFIGRSWNTLTNHTHLHYFDNYGDKIGSTINPLLLWNDPAYKDPQGNVPQVLDANGDGDKLKFKKTPNTPDFFPDDGKVHNGVDIIAEAVDKQSSDAPWQNPGRIGYFIEKFKNGNWVDAVKSAASPYIIFNSTIFYNSSSRIPNDGVVKTIIDYRPEFMSQPPNTPADYLFKQWFTYIVTNGKGNDGAIADLDSNQCWATDARNTVGTPNGYQKNYDQARIIDEAKFEDANYRVNIRLRDLTTPANPFQKEIKVDNFRPYAKKVTIKGSELDYAAHWIWDKDAGQLDLDLKDNQKKVCGEVTIRITMSEPMKDVKVAIPSLEFPETVAKVIAGSDDKLWEIVIPEEYTKDKPEGPHKVEINGVDKAGTELQGFADKGPKPGDFMEKRKLDGSWIPGAGPTKDVIHEFRVMKLEMDVAVTPPTSCKKNDATATIITLGENGKLLYAVDGSNFQPGATFKNLAPGLHTAIVRKEETGCEFTKEFDVPEANDSMDLTVSGYGTLEICEDQDASITLTASASGGSGNFEYNWPGGSLTVHGSGRYTAVVVDKETGCSENMSGDVVIIRVVCSRDPNDIIGPEGYGPGKMIAKSKAHSYMVRFENDPDFATAPAQVVRINHPLDSNINLYSLRLGDFGFAGMTFPVPADKTFYTTRLNVMDSLGVVVDVTAGIDVTKREVFWVFESKDPATGLPPADALLGFLPINDSTGRGEGFVTYTIKAANHTHTGDSIRAKASIVFDLNAPIETPVVFNTIDALPPVSHVSALPATSKVADFRVSWSGQDDAGGSGVRDYVLYVSENGGTFKAVQAATADTAITFSGTPGSTYSFFTLSSDNTGNQEATKHAGEATIKIENACPAEICNGVDDDCDGEVDEGFTKYTYYRDADGDGFGSTQTITVCESTAPAGYTTVQGDCNDNDNTVNPGATEICDNNKDDNCNGVVDENCGITRRYYQDIDRDGYGRDQGSRLSDKPIPGWVLVGGDCADWDATVYPGAPERANGFDDNCNGQVDEGLPMLRYYMDVDRDGYGRNDNSKLSAIPLAGHVLVNGDCKDWDATVYPGAPEQANGFDDNCNGQVDEGLPMLRYYMDVDRDGYGRNDNSKLSAIPLAGHVLVNGDCKDWDATVYPGAPEQANGFDDNCNGQVDEGLPMLRYYMDVDRDGYGRNENSKLSAIPLAGHVLVGGDCKDWDATVHPGAVEVKNGRDDNCNGQVDEQLITGTQGARESAGKQAPESPIAAAGEFQVVVSPVPSYHTFTVHLQQGEPLEKIRIRVYDQVGRLVEVRDNLAIGARITLGGNYAKGHYTLEAVQGRNRKLIKLIRL